MCIKLSENLNDARAILMRLKRSDRAKAYVESNTWQWPKVLRDFEPAGFSEIRDFHLKYESSDFKALINLLYSVTTEYQRSRQWWKEQGIKAKYPISNHMEWYRNLVGKQKI